MKQVFLIHDGLIQHYRVPIYGYLNSYLKNQGYDLTVISEGIQADCPDRVDFPLIIEKMKLAGLIRAIKQHKPHACILFINHSKRYFFPLLFWLKNKRFKTITWTHGIDLQRKHSLVSRLAHHLEHSLCDGIILYAEQLKDNLLNRHKKKAFTANNTLFLAGFRPRPERQESVLKKHGIAAAKNIIFMGRLTRRKRIEDLLAAFDLIKNNNYGLIFAGPDVVGILSHRANKDPRIYHVGPTYGPNALDLLSACDVFCMPAAIGLSIVDAMFCGLPVVTEDVDHGPEIMYFREGVNGFMVKAGDTQGLADRLRLLLEDDLLRLRMGENARKEIETTGHIDNLCQGFVQCLDFVIGRDRA